MPVVTKWPQDSLAHVSGKAADVAAARAERDRLAAVRDRQRLMFQRGDFLVTKARCLKASLGLPAVAAGPTARSPGSRSPCTPAPVRSLG